MATPPRVTDEQCLTALRAISQRRAAVDDPHREQLGDDPDLADVLHVLAYLRKHSGPPVSEAVRRADIVDALRLRVWLWWHGTVLERQLLERAEQLGMNRREIGRLLGIRTSQGIVDRRDRLQALLGEHGRPDEKLIRAERATGRTTTGLPRRQQQWLDRHRTAIRKVAATLVEHEHLADDEAAEWIIEVARDLKQGVCTPGSYTQVFYAVDAMATVPAVVGLADTHPLQRALRDWQVLAAQYRRLRNAATT